MQLGASAERPRSEAAERVVRVAADRIVWAWARQPGESCQAFAAFEAYRDSVVWGRRSIRGTAAKLGKSRQLLERWSVRYRWGARCDQFDRAHDRLRLARHMAEQAEKAARLARAQETVRYIAIRGAHAEVDRLLSDEDFMLSAALMLPLDDLIDLVGGPSELLTAGLGRRGAEARPFHESARTRGWADGWAEQRCAAPKEGATLE